MTTEKLLEKLDKLKQENRKLKSKITALKKENTELAEGQKKYKEIFNSTNDAIFLHDAVTGKIIDVNKAMLEMYGYEYDEVFELSGELLGRDEGAFTVDDAHKKLTKAINEGPQVFDWIAKQKNGNKFWVEVSLKYCADADDKFVIAVVRNINERKKFEDKLKESEEKFSKAFATNPHSVDLVTLEDGKYIDTNASYTKIFGYKKEEVLDKTSLELNIWVDPNQRKEIVADLKKHKKVCDRTVYYRTKKGKIITCLFSGEIIKIKNKECLFSFVDDITEITKTKIERDRLAELVESTSDIITINDPKGKIIYLNKSAKELYAYRKQKNKKKLNVSDFHPEWVQEKLKNIAIPIAYENGMWLGETAVFGGIKNEIPVSQLLMVQKDKEGDVEHISSIMRDISERKQTEDALKESESKFRKLFESSIDAIFIYKGKYVVDCNYKALEMFGCTREKLIGAKLTAFSPEFQPNGQKSITEADKKAEAVLSGEEQTFEWQHLRFNGDSFETEVNLNLVELDSGKFVQAIVRDISDRKQSENIIKASEERFRSFIKQTTEAVNCYEYEGGIDTKSSVEDQAQKIFEGVLVECNDSFAKAYGLNDASDCIGKRFKDFVKEEEKESIFNLFKEFIKTGYKIVDGESVEVLNNGETKYFLNNAHGTIEKDRLIRVWAIIKDITDRKLLEQSIVHQRDLLKQSSKLAQIAYWEYNILEDKTIWSYELSSMLGYIKTDKEMTYDKGLSVVHPDDLENIKGIDKRIKNNEISELDNVEYRVIKSNGEVAWLWERGTVAKDSKGNPIKYSAVVQDITERKKAEKDLQVRLEFEKLVTKISSKFLSISVQDIENEIIEELRDIMNFMKADRITVFEYIGKDEVYPSYSVSADGIPLLKYGNFVNLLPWFVKQIKNDCVVLLNDVSQLPESAEDEIKYVKENGIKSSITVPIKFSKKIIGAFNITTFNDFKEWTQTDVNRLTILSEIIVNAIYRLKNYKELEERFNFEHAISELQGNLISITPESIDQEILGGLKIISDNLKIDRCGLFQFNSDKKELTVVYSWARDPYKPRKGINYEKQFKWLYKKIFIGETIIINDLSELPNEAFQEIEFCESENIKSFIDVPIFVDNKIFGAIGLSVISKKRKWNKNDVYKAKIFGEIIANALIRKNIEKAIIENESKFRGIVENSVDCIILVNEKGEVIEWNSGAENITGKNKEEVIDRLYAEVVRELVPDYVKAQRSLDETISRIKKRLKGEDKSGLKDFAEFELLRADGKIIYAEQNQFLIKRESGNWLCNIVRDVTEKKIYEKSIKESEDKFRSIIENSDDCVILVNEEGKVIEWNVGAEKLLGRKKSEVLSKLYADVIHSLSDTENKKLMDIGSKRKKVELMLQERETQSLNNYDEFQVLRPDGQTRFAAQNQFLIKRDNGNWLCNIVRDITDKKIYEKSIEESEKRFRTLINTTTASIFIIQNSKIIFVNKRGEELLGISKDTLRAVDLLELFYKEDKEKIDKQMSDTLAGKDAGIVEARVLNKDGKKYWVEYSSGLIDIESKSLLIGTAIDITERKIAEEGLEKSRESYRELFEFSQNILDNERKRLAKDLHDIVGQRLTFAKINLEMMKEADHVQNPKLINAMDNIIQVGKDLRNIVASLTPSLIENFSLVEAINRLVKEIKLNMEIEIDFSVEEKSEVKNKKIELNTFRIIQESLNNSLKHSEANNMNIFLRIESHQVIGKIKDDGKGFELDALYSETTGFGINNMKERAELLGGNLYISSEISNGTTIEFVIPQ